MGLSTLQWENLLTSAIKIANSIIDYNIFTPLCSWVLYQLYSENSGEKIPTPISDYDLDGQMPLSSWAYQFAVSDLRRKRNPTWDLTQELTDFWLCSPVYEFKIHHLENLNTRIRHRVLCPTLLILLLCPAHHTHVMFTVGHDTYQFVRQTSPTIMPFVFRASILRLKSWLPPCVALALPGFVVVGRLCNSI